MNAEVQHVIALGIVLVAAIAVGRRLWGLMMAFRSRPARRRNSAAHSQASHPTSSPLIQIQTRPPAHLKRPSVDDK